jgi:hypothetical protein
LAALRLGEIFSRHKRESLKTFRADWPTDLMIHRRGAENAEKTYKNLCELGVSAVNPTGKVKFVGQPACPYK